MQPSVWIPKLPSTYWSPFPFPFTAGRVKSHETPALSGEITNQIINEVIL